MGEEASKPSAAERKAAALKKWVVIALLWTGLLVFITLIVGLRSGKGVFSVIHALQAANARTVAIDIDDSSLLAPFLVVGGLCVGAVYAFLEVQRSRVSLMIACLPAILVGSYLDARFGHEMVGNLMDARGYIRCHERDHTEGRGKSWTLYDNYVLDSASCRATARRS